ncbi:MAG TPA: UdgX family uracil-DNA binding protein [Candidatus Binatia bacterium]|nr:UdgX family uracil-DNA binding protein [Candidatus Binatia bacterium]
MVVRSNSSAAEFLPKRFTLEDLEAAAESCKGCDLYKNATQTVFGEGLQGASIMFVGEQPGDMEDRQGQPFVGPAGRLLDKALDAAGIPRQETYVTNAVKHFKFIQRGKRRLHQKPTIRQVMACRPWLEAEIEIIQPRVIVALGSTAAHAVLRRAVRINQERGRFISLDSREAFITVHPSAILRLQESSERQLEFDRLVHDLKAIGRKLKVRKTA